MYHILSRTNSGDSAFRDQADEHKFLEYLAKFSGLFGVRVHAWCLMSTHFHLLVETGPDPALSEMMRRLLTAYTVYYNRRTLRHGHLFQGRFRSLVVDKADYLLKVSRYIHLNPFHAKITDDPFKYSGSSLGYYVSGNEPKWLDTRETLAWFEGDRKKYARFIREGLGREIALEAYQQRYIGGEKFAARIRKRLDLREQPASRAAAAQDVRAEQLRQRQEREAKRLLKAVAEYYDVNPNTLRRLLYLRGPEGKARKVLAALLRDRLTWSCREIGEYLGLKRNVERYLGIFDGDEELRMDYENIKVSLSRESDPKM